MQAIIFFIVMTWVLSTNAHAAGFQSTSFLDKSGVEIRLGIWYPSNAPKLTRDLGPFKHEVATDGRIHGTRLPLIVVSHGTGGSAFTHYDTAIALAEAGFVVAALTHPGDNYQDQSKAVDVLARPGHVRDVIDFMLGAWDQRSALAPSRIGMFGHSSGAFTTLVSVGGMPSLGQIEGHCKSHGSDYACALLARQPIDASVPVRRPVHDERITAAVIAAPALGFTFDRAALRGVTIPIQLWRAEHDGLLPHPWYDEAVRAALPVPPDYHVVAGAGHFDFLAPCSEKLARIAPPICVSEERFDRIAFHRMFNAQIIAFFKRTLDR